MHSLLKSDAPDVHFPDSACTCLAGPIYDWTLREFSNGTLHVYRYCRSCGARARSPVKRETIGLAKWKEILIASGHLTVATHG